MTIYADRAFNPQAFMNAAIETRRECMEADAPMEAASCWMTAGEFSSLVVSHLGVEAVDDRRVLGIPINLKIKSDRPPAAVPCTSYTRRFCLTEAAREGQA